MSAASHVRTRFVPVSCFIYRSQEVKPCEKWSTYIKIELNQTFSDLKKRFQIADYGGFKKNAEERRIGKLDFGLGVKHKKPDPPEFPNGRMYLINSEEEWKIYEEFLFGSEGNEYELVGMYNTFCLKNIYISLKCHQMSLADNCKTLITSKIIQMI